MELLKVRSSTIYLKGLKGQHLGYWDFLSLVPYALHPPLGFSAAISKKRERDCRLILLLLFGLQRKQGREGCKGFLFFFIIPPSSSSSQALSRVERKRGDQPSKEVSARELAPRGDKETLIGSLLRVDTRRGRTFERLQANPLPKTTNSDSR